MNINGIEREAKFWISDLSVLRARLEKLRAELIQTNILESNWRFDKPDRSLSSSGQVLRLRQDAKCRLTYKSPAVHSSSVSARKEIEFIVSHQADAWQFLEALGFECIALYEKYRSAYLFKGCEISLDEMPFGTFCEIEGKNARAIKTAASALNLYWEARTQLSYLALFASLKETFDLPFDYATFQNFKDYEINLSAIGLVPADQPPR